MLRVLAWLSASALLSQSFEVASIKIHREPPGIINLTTVGPILRAEAQMLGGLVIYAYDLKNYQLAWASPKLSFDDVYFDIMAKADGDTTPSKAVFRKMLQSLLADRFQLHIHREMRELPVYALVLGKSGPKFRESPPDAAVSGRHTMHGRNQVMTLSQATMEDVVASLSVYTSRPVIDQTGLRGAYDIKLEAAPAFRLSLGAADPSDISIFVAVQEQLGLRLEPLKAKVDVLVVDHAELPSGN